MTDIPSGATIRLANVVAELYNTDALERLDHDALRELGELVGMAQDAIRRRQRAIDHVTMGPPTISRASRELAHELGAGPIITESELRLLDGDR